MQVNLFFPANVQQHWAAYNFFAYASNIMGQSPASAAFPYKTSG